MIVTLEEAKGYLRVDYDDDDELIESFMPKAETMTASTPVSHRRRTLTVSDFLYHTTPHTTKKTTHLTG